MKDERNPLFADVIIQKGFSPLGRPLMDTTEITESPDNCSLIAYC